MTKKFVDKVRKSDIAMRPVLPLAFPLELGQVGTVGDDGVFSLRGSITTLLGLTSLGKVLPVQDKALNLSVSSDRSVQVKFGANADTSGTLSQFADLKAKASITFGADDGFFIAVDGMRIRQLAEPQNLLNAILWGYRKGVWKEDWVFIHQIGVAKHLTVVIARAANTTALLKASATANLAKKAEVDLAAGFKFVASNKSVTQITGAKNLAVFYSAYKVSDRLFRNPKIEKFDLAFGLDVRDMPEAARVARASAAAYRKL